MQVFKVSMHLVHHTFRFQVKCVLLLDSPTEQRGNQCVMLTFHSEIQHIEKQDPAHCTL